MLSVSRWNRKVVSLWILARAWQLGSGAWGPLHSIFDSLPHMAMGSSKSGFKKSLCSTQDPLIRAQYRSFKFKNPLNWGQQCNLPSIWLEKGKRKGKPIFIELWVFQELCYMIYIGYLILSLETTTVINAISQKTALHLTTVIGRGEWE